MSQKNVEIVRSTLDAFTAGDRDRMLTSVDPEVVIDASRRVLNPGTYVGIAGVGQMLADMHETWEGLHLEQQEFIDAGDRVAVIGRLVGKGKGSGVEVERPVNGQVWTLRNGRVVRLEFGFTDRKATLEAAGIYE
jgi:ketosteroid isomerase-like protein